MSSSIYCIKCQNSPKKLTPNKAKYQFDKGDEIEYLCGNCTAHVNRLPENEIKQSKTTSSSSSLLTSKAVTQIETSDKAFATSDNSNKTSANPLCLSSAKAQVSKNTKTLFKTKEGEEIDEEEDDPLDEEEANTVISDVTGSHLSPGGTMTQKATGASKVRNVVCDLAFSKTTYKRIIEWLNRESQALRLSDDEALAIKQMDVSDELFFLKIMQKAFTYAGGREEIHKVASCLAKALKDNADAEADAKHPIVVPKVLLPCLYNSKSTICPIDEDSTNFLSEAGTTIIHSDINVIIQNCNLQYLQALGYDNILEWIDNPRNIYVGPKGVLRVPSEPNTSINDSHDDIPWPNEDSKFYLRLKPGHSRVIDNRKQIKEIIKRLDEGLEDKDKYLQLKGKILGCVCSPMPCHCEVYVEVLRHLNKLGQMTRCGDVMSASQNN